MSSKRRRHHHTLAMGLLASLMAPTAAWAQTGAEQTLLDQGQYWQERGDTERAGEAWQKLLRLNPQNAQALYGMALVELNAQRLEGAQRYLTQLQAAHPRNPGESPSRAWQRKLRFLKCRRCPAHNSFRAGWRR